MADVRFPSKGHRRREASHEFTETARPDYDSRSSRTVWRFGGYGKARSGADGEIRTSHRTIGGAMYDGMNTVRELPFAEKEGLSFLEKERIAEAAAALIEEGDVVGLSGGTTSYYLAKLLKTRRGITVVTNTVNVAMELAGSDIQVVVTGGMMRHNSFELCGPLGEGMIGQLNLGKMFLGVDGVSSTGGITTYSEQEAQIAKAMIRRSQATYAMFDHTKIGRTSLFSIAPLSELQGLITDMPLPQQLTAAAESFGIQVFLAGEER